jgi:hypothetical protein
MGNATVSTYPSHRIGSGVTTKPSYSRQICLSANDEIKDKLRNRSRSRSPLRICEIIFPFTL